MRKPKLFVLVLLGALAGLPGVLPAQIQTPLSFDTAVVSVTGTGDAFAPASRAVVYMEIVTEDGAADAAALANADRRAAVVTALGDLGFDRDEITLWGYGNGHPGSAQFAQMREPAAAPRHETRSGIRIEIEDLDRLDAVAAAALMAGASSTSVELHSDRLEEARRQASEMAVRRARAEAEAIAAAAGGRLGALVSLTSSSPAGAFGMLLPYPSALMDGGVSISPASVTVHASVQATWVFEEGSTP